MTLDTFVMSTGKGHIPFTRMRAPYVNPDGFRFRVYRAGVFTELGKILGMQDIEVGHSEFDRAFVIQGNDPVKVHLLFGNAEIRRLLEAQPSIQSGSERRRGLVRNGLSRRSRRTVFPGARHHQGHSPSEVAVSSSSRRRSITSATLGRPMKTIPNSRSNNR